MSQRQYLSTFIFLERILRQLAAEMNFDMVILS